MRRKIPTLLLVSVAFAAFCAEAWATEPPIGGGGTCSYSAGAGGFTGQQKAFNNGLYVCSGGVWVKQAFVLGSKLQDGSDATTCDSTYEGMQRYNSTDKTMEYCNGAAWTAVVQVQSTPAVTAPSGSGYFVMTHTTYNGDLGGIAGADAKCLTELGTTYTSWRGYTTANGNGQITAGKVKAVLCGDSSCTNLMPLTTYYFAYADSGTPGGASFTTDASGLAPGDANSWAAANYFSGTYSWWSNRAIVSATTWDNNPDYTYSCYDWTLDDGCCGTYGSVANTTAVRWLDNTGDCNVPRHLICMVNP